MIHFFTMSRCYKGGWKFLYFKLRHQLYLQFVFFQTNLWHNSSETWRKVGSYRHSIFCPCRPSSVKTSSCICRERDIMSILWILCTTSYQSSVVGCTGLSHFLAASTMYSNFLWVFCFVRPYRTRLPKNRLSKDKGKSIEHTLCKVHESQTRISWWFHKMWK